MELTAGHISNTITKLLYELNIIVITKVGRDTSPGNTNLCD